MADVFLIMKNSVYILIIFYFSAIAPVNSADDDTDAVKTLKRLPNWVIPELYDLHLLINLTLTNNSRHKLDTTGSVNITLRVIHDTKFFYLSADEDLVIHSSYFITPNSPEILSIINLPLESRVKISLQQTLKANSLHELHLEFSPSTRRRINGQGLYSVPAVKLPPVVTVNTHLEPIYARHMFPCFDEPSFKAAFRVSITHKSQYEALSNMPVEQVTTLDENWTHTQFSPTPKMSPYILSIAVVNLTIASANFTSIDGRVIPVTFYHEEWMSEAAAISLDITVKVLQLFETWTQSRYPLPKMDCLTTRIPAWAMENWGLISISSNLLLSELFDEVLMTEIMAHEVAHQWFGNLVTPSWWTDLWLKEGFASYLAVLATQTLMPEKHFTASHLMQILGNSKTQVMDDDSLSSSKPLSRVIRTDGDIVANFDAISYGKSCLLIAMIHKTMTDVDQEGQWNNRSSPSNIDLAQTMSNDPFIKGTRYYIDQYSYSVASKEQLWKSFTNVGNIFTHDTLENIMKPWTGEWGYPVLGFHVDYDTGEITISQKRFVTDFSESDETFVWTFQITIISSKGLRKPFWVRKQTQVIQFDPENIGDWIMVETASRSYYRVNYDFHTWNKIIDAMHKNSSVFTSVQKSELFDDAWAIGFTGEIPLEVPLLLSCRAVVNETDDIFWYTVISILDAKVDVFNQNPKVKEYFRKFVRKILSHFPSHEERKILELKRDRVLYMYEKLLCEIEDETMLQIVQQRLNNFLANISLPNDELNTLCYAVKHYGINETNIFDFVNHPRRAYNLAIPLYTNNMTQFEQVFNMSKNLTISDQDLAWHPMRYIECGDYIGSEFIWNYVMDNFDTIWNALTTNRIKGYFIEIHFKTVFTQDKLNQMIELERSRFSTLGAAQNTFLKYKQKAIRSIGWNENRFVDRMVAWIKKMTAYPNYYT